jgi:hypothetical protein
MRNKELKTLRRCHPHEGEDFIIARAVTAFTEKLRVMHQSDEGKRIYHNLLVLPGLLETIGVMVKQNYVNLEDIADLFEWSITDFDIFFRDHIRERQKEPGVPSRYLQNALTLADQVRRLRYSSTRVTP